MQDQPELAFQAGTPNAATVKKLRSSVGRLTSPDASVDDAIAAAFSMRNLMPTQSLTDSLRLLKAAIPGWQNYTFEAYAEEDADGGEWAPEVYHFRLTTPNLSLPEIHGAFPEKVMTLAVLEYLLKAPTDEQVAADRAAREARAQSLKSAQSIIEENEAEEQARRPKRYEGDYKALDWDAYPATAAGVADYYADWLHNIREQMLQFPDDNIDASTTAGTVLGYERTINVLRRQAKAIELVEQLMDAEYTKSPSPRMKALKAAIEAIYTE